MINFIGSQGYNTNGLSNVTFYRGSLTGQSVYNTMGNPAIKIGNSIHVASSAWGRISSPSGGATYFEEIVHTRQYESWGMVGFGAAYGVASAMGKYNTGDAHNNPVEIQAIARQISYYVLTTTCQRTKNAQTRSRHYCRGRFWDEQLQQRACL